MRFLVAGILAGALTGNALAADLPVKAPVIPTAFPLASSGFYYGLYAAGAAGQADLKNPPTGFNPASLTTTQGEVGGVVGYRFGSSNMARFLDLELDVGYNNLNGPVVIEAGARVGVPMAAITSLFPNLGLLNFPALPPPTGTSVLATQVYIGGAVRFEDISVNFGLPSNQEWGISPALWVGMIQGLSNGTAMDFRFEYIGQTDKCIGPAGGGCGQLDHRLMAKVVFDF